VSKCGGWGGLNDHTYFVRRASAAFESVSTGQLATAYDDVQPAVRVSHNPEWLFWYHTNVNGVRVALVPPCQFNVLSLRNMSGSLCFDFASVHSSVHTELFHCSTTPRNPVVGACQTATNREGRIDLTALGDRRICPKMLS